MRINRSVDSAYRVRVMLSVDTAKAVRRYIVDSMTRSVWIALIGAWVLVVAGGLGWLSSYKATRGADGSAPASWPVETGVAREPGKATLVMLAHPHCPCTRATLAELETI